MQPRGPRASSSGPCCTRRLFCPLETWRQKLCCVAKHKFSNGQLARYGIILDWSLIGIDSAGEVIAIGRLPVPYCAVQYSAGDLDSNPVTLNGIYCSRWPNDNCILYNTCVNTCSVCQHLQNLYDPRTSELLKLLCIWFSETRPQTMFALICRFALSCARGPD